MSSVRRQFLVELVKQHNPALMNTDVQDVATAIGISLEDGEVVAAGLQNEGYLSIAGLGGNIIPTQEGREAAEDPDWE